VNNAIDYRLPIDSSNPGSALVQYYSYYSFQNHIIEFVA